MPACLANDDQDLLTFEAGYLFPDACGNAGRGSSDTFYWRARRGRQREIFLYPKYLSHL